MRMQQPLGFVDIDDQLAVLDSCPGSASASHWLTVGSGGSPGHISGSAAPAEPGRVHYGLAEEKIARGAAVLAPAHTAHPERFTKGILQPPALPKEVWIN